MMISDFGIYRLVELTCCAGLFLGLAVGCGGEKASAPPTIDAPVIVSDNPFGSDDPFGGDGANPFSGVDESAFDIPVVAPPAPAMPPPSVVPSPVQLPDSPAESPDSFVRSKGSGSERVSPNDDKRLAVAVLDFEDTSAKSDYPKLNRALQSMLTTDLSVSRDLQLVERARLEDIRSELKLAKSGFLDPATAAKVGKGVGAKAVLTGSFWIRDDNMRIDARLVHVATGKVILAEQISGNPQDLTKLEKSLASKVLAATGVRLSAFENAEISHSHTSNLLAASRYGQALADLDAGDFANAEKNAKAALRLDPEFVLAERQLAMIEKDAMFRLSIDGQKKAAFSGAVGEQLKQHRSQFQKVADSDGRDASYFASLLVLSVHAGLTGDSDEERRLLFQFWEHFATSVEPSNCIAMSTAIRKIVFSEGEFFRKTIDSGNYGMSAPVISFGEPDPDFDPNADNLKPELRANYRWPKWSTLWPIDTSLRGAYGTLAPMGKIDNEWFDEFLPKYPHDYLEKITEAVWELKHEDQREHARVLRSMFSICLYYNKMTSIPSDLNGGIRTLQSNVVSQLDDIAPHNQSPQFVLEATKALDVIGKVEPDVSKREKANKLLVRFARQAQLNRGTKPSNDADGSSALTIYGKKFEATTAIFLRRTSMDSGMDVEKMGIRKSVESELTDAVLGMRGQGQSINVFWSSQGFTGDDEVSRLFPSPVDLNDKNRQTTLQSISTRDRERKKNEQSFDQLLRSLVDDFNSDCCVVLDAQDGEVTIERTTIEKIRDADASPRFIILASERNQSLLNLAIASDGAFVALKSKGGLFGGGDVTATFANLTNAEVRFDD